MRITFYITLLIVTCTSCKKEIPSILNSYQGDYYYTYTKLEESDLIVSTEMENDFGLRITSSNKIKTFVNGKLLGIYKYKGIKNYQEEINFSSFFFEPSNSNKYSSPELRLYSDGHIEFFDFPIKFKKNVFHP
jgi:hypothetical protein